MSAGEDGNDLRTLLVEQTHRLLTQLEADAADLARPGLRVDAAQLQLGREVLDAVRAAVARVGEAADLSHDPLLRLPREKEL